MVALFLATTALWAYDFKDGDLYYYIRDTYEKEVAVTYEGIEGNPNYVGLTSVTIPSTVTYKGTTYAVTHIGYRAFFYCKNLTSVTIPNSVESIGEEAFYDCTGLTSITIPNSVKSIDYYAFGNVLNIVYNGTATGSPWGAKAVNGYVESPFVYEDATKTKLLACSTTANGDISIPNTVTSIAKNAFRGCSGITSVTIPNSVTSIGNNTFSYCTGLVSITIPNSVTSIGSNAFYGILNVVYSGTATGSPWGGRGVNGYVEDYFLYEDATKNKILACSTAAPDGIVIPSSVTSIGDEAFRYCTLLKSITIPESITSIGDRAFYGCSNLTSVVWNAKNCSGWSSSDAPFYNISSNIKSFAFGNTVESIPDCLCSYMDYLFTVTIPNSVTSIGKSSFNWGSLKYVCVLCSTPPSCHYSSFRTSTIIIVPEEAISTYSNHTDYKKYTIISYGLGQFKEATATQTMMNVQWTIYGKNKSGINGFQYSADYNFASDATNTIYLNVATDSVTQTDTLITGLIPNVTYYLRSFIQTSDGQLVYGKTTSKTTQGIQLSVSNTSKTQKTLGIRMQYDAGDATHYGINGFIYCKGSSFNGNAKVDTVYFNKQDSAAVLDTIVRNLTPNTTYCFRTFLRTPYSQTVESSDISITTEAITSSATAVTSTQKTIAARLKYDWGDAENIAKYGYTVVGTPFTDTLPAAGTITEPLTIDTLITGLTPNTEYTFRTFIETRDSTPVKVWSEDFSSGISTWEKQVNSYGVWGCANGVCTFTSSYKYYEASGWLFHSVNLIGGTEYTFRVRVMKSTYSSSYTVPDMAIGIGSTANSSSMTTIVSKGTINTEYEEVIGTYTPAESGTYYVGLYGHMKDPGPANYANTIYFDDFSVSSPLSGKIPTYITNEQTLKTLPVAANISCSSRTQTTLTLLGSYDCGDVTNTGVNGIQWNQGTSLGSDYTTIAFNKTDSAAQMETTLTGLQPNTTYCAHVYVVTAESDTIYSDIATYTTQAITTTTTSVTRTQTKLGVSFKYDWGDADNVTRYGYEVVGTSVRDTFPATGTISDTIKIDTLVTGLVPDTEYNFCTFIETRDSVPADSIIYIGDFLDDIDDYATANSYGKWSCSNGVCSFQRSYYGEAIGQLYYEVYLKAGVAYKISTYIKKRYDSSSYAEPDIKLIVNTGSNVESFATITSKTSLSAEYEEVTGSFTPTETKFYLIGIYGRMPYSYYKASNIIDINEFSISTASLNRKELRTIRNKRIYSTLPVSISMAEYAANRTQTTLSVNGLYDCGDATNTGKNGIQYCEGASFGDEYKTIAINRTDSAAQLDTIITGLKHYTQYSVRAYVETEGGNIAYSEVQTYWTRDVDMTFQSVQSTQTQATFHITYDAGDLPLVNSGIQYCVGSSFSADEAQTFYFNRTDSALAKDTTITGLTPNTEYAFRAFVETQDKKIYSSTRKVTTLPVTISDPTLTQYGQTYMLLATNSNYGDATLVEEAVEYGTSQSETQKASVSNNMVKINNLLPDTRYYYRSLLTTAEGGTIYSDWQEMTTKAITLSTGEADGISAKSVFLHGTIDCDMESRTEIGFEWKRSDAPSTVKPQRVLVTDRVDSNLVFRLEGLGKDKYYDYRAFCLYKEQTYYGQAEDGREWVTFLTAEDDVLVAPSVQTLGAEATETGVTLKGFVVAGTENIIQQGFESWRVGSTDVATTVSTGAIMTNTIPEPWSYTDYQYRAYAKTPSGTTYGETKAVTTGYIHTDIQDVVVTPSATTANVTWTIVEQANYYILTLFGNAEMTDTLATYIVDTEGNITQRRAPAALRALVNCNIDQLTPETDYFFTVIAYNADEKKVAEENGTFTTTQPTTDIDNISYGEGDSDINTTTHHSSGNLVRKVFRNGQVYILRNGKTYTATGVEVK